MMRSEGREGRERVGAKAVLIAFEGEVTKGSVACAQSRQQPFLTLFHVFASLANFSLRDDNPETGDYTKGQ